MNSNPNNTIDTNLLRQIFFIAAIVFLGIVLFRQLWFFSSAFLGAVTFYVSCASACFTSLKTGAGKNPLPPWILMLLSFFVILVPIGILGNILYSKIADIVTHSGEYLNSLKRFTDQIEHKTGYVIVKPQNIDQLGSYLTQLLPKVLGVTMNTLALIAAMYFILFFMLVNGRAMEEALYEYIPLKDGNVELIGQGSKSNGSFQYHWYSPDSIDPGRGWLDRLLIIGIKDPGFGLWPPALLQ